jgi:hypothetical protein
MYRAPASRSGAPGFLMLIVILWGAVNLTGCTDTSSNPELDNMPPVEDVEIELATDPDLTASLIEDVSSSMAANMTTAASVEIVTAEGLFSQANLALTSGDLDRVRSLGDQARDALGQALSRGRNRSSLDDFIDRARNVRRRLANGDTDEFDRPDELRRQLDRLLDETDIALSRGDDAAAGRRAVDAQQRTDRSRARRHDADPEKGARLAVAMANQAVALANRLLDGTEIDERTQHLLDTAARLAAASAEAFGSGHFRQAIMLGHKAVNVSLMAVIRPDKVTDVGFEALIAAAEAELAAARAALDLEPNEELEKLLSRAVEAFESGVELIRSGNDRGIHLVWKAAVVGAVIAS